MTDLEREAREAAGRYADREGTSPLSMMSFEDGYLAAAAPREQEIEELRAELAKTKLPIWILREEHEQEVSALRARVAELEGMVPKWAEGPERYRLEKLGWCVAGGEMVWHRKPGNIEASWHCLMVPPISLPETKP